MLRIGRVIPLDSVKCELRTDIPIKQITPTLALLSHDSLLRRVRGNIDSWSEEEGGGEKPPIHLVDLLRDKVSVKRARW